MPGGEDVTDLATTPGTEETRPEDAALIDDPTSVSDSDVDLDLDPADEAESDEEDELETSDAIVADDEADADADVVAEDEPATADEAELDADEAEDVEASAEAEDGADADADAEPEDNVEDEPADDTGPEDELEASEDEDDHDVEDASADDAEPTVEGEPEDNAEDEPTDKTEDEDNAEDELETADQDDDQPADEAVADVEQADEVESEDDIEDEPADEAVTDAEPKTDTDAEADAESPEGEDAEDEPADEVELEDDEPADDAVTDAEPDADAESPEDEDDDTEFLNDLEFLEDTELLDEPADLVDLDVIKDDAEATDEAAAAALATVGAAAAATSAAATATAVLPASATATAAPTTAPSAPPLSGGPGAPVFAWAPAEPQPHKSRKPLWIGLGAGAAAIGLVVASLVLIAPGTSIAGVPVGFLTQAAATEAVQQRLATTTIVLTGEGGDAEVTGADLGASVDASGLAADAFAAHPMWNVTAWFPAPADVPVRIDMETANSALRAVAPELYTDPVDATLAFDATSASFVTTSAELGTGIDVDAVRTALQDAFASGETRVELEATVAPVEATTPTYVAEASAKQLNGILDNAGFYVGAERTVPVDRAVAASWLTVTPGDRGTFQISADESAIEEIVPTLPAAVNREAVNETVITDSAGKVLRDLTDGVSGRLLGDTSDVASEYAAQLGAGNPAYQLPVEETPFVTTTLERRIEVDLSAQTTYLFENDQVIGSYAISSGLAGTPTHTGSYRIFAHVPIQDMGALCYNPAAQNSYCTEDVPWITYFNGDQGFHGTYWHNNFGNPMSHGCVNMPINTAKFVYDWAPTGTEVWVHA